MGSRRSTQNPFSRWRKHRRLRREAKHLLKETRRILRKYGYRIKEEISDQVSQAQDALRQALDSKRHSQIRDRTEKLDDLVEKHLAFGRKSAFREYTESIGIAVLVALLLRAFVVEAFKIPSGSMLPTLEVGDHLFVNKFIYGFRIPFTNIKFLPIKEPRRGEVIVFVYPKDEDKDFIKRIMAVGGDTIAFRNNTVLVNGKPVKRRRLPGPCIYPDVEEGSDRWEPRPCIAYEEEQDGTRYRVIYNLDGFSLPDPRPQKVPEGHVFVMGDNRDNSHDSRFWQGERTVPFSHIKGRAIFIWWSHGQPDGIRWGRFFKWVHSDPDGQPIQL